MEGKPVAYSKAIAITLGAFVLVGCQAPNSVNHAVDEAQLNQMRLYENELASSYRSRELKISEYSTLLGDQENQYEEMRVSNRKLKSTIGEEKVELVSAETKLKQVSGKHKKVKTQVGTTKKQLAALTT